MGIQEDGNILPAVLIVCSIPSLRASISSSDVMDGPSLPDPDASI